MSQFALKGQSSLERGEGSESYWGPTLAFDDCQRIGEDWDPGVSKQVLEGLEDRSQVLKCLEDLSEVLARLGETAPGYQR